MSGSHPEPKRKRKMLLCCEAAGWVTFAAISPPWFGVFQNLFQAKESVNRPEFG